MGLFDFLRPKKHIQLVCFDLDNTLYDYGTAEAQTEVYLAQLIAADINKKSATLRASYKKSAYRKSQKEKPSFASLEPTTVLRLFTDVKKSHMHHDTDPLQFSRALWISQTLERLDLEQVFGVDMNQLLRNAQVYEQKYWDYLIPRLQVFPGTIQTLTALKQRGKKLALLTDSDGVREIKLRRIRSAGLDRFFDFIVTTDDTGVNKPDIKNFSFILHSANLRGKDCVMVGDHPNVDLYTAKRLGFTTIWTKEHLNSDVAYAYVDFDIHRIEQVVDIIDMIEK